MVGLRPSRAIPSGWRIGRSFGVGIRTTDL